MKFTLIVILIIVTLGMIVLLLHEAKASKKEDLSLLKNPNSDHYAVKRAEMVKNQIQARGVKDPKVLEAMQKVPRHLFVPKNSQDQAYNDYPLPIGEGQTISQPYIVALMTELAQLEGSQKVLEIGTGSGYQAAILAELAKEVYSIEIVDSLCISARNLLTELGYKNVQVICGDGYKGLPDQAPFDAIIVTAAPEKIPPPLKEQLKVGGRLVIPVGTWSQELKLITKTQAGISASNENFKEKSVIPVRFVPMTGEAQNKK